MCSGGASQLPVLLATPGRGKLGAHWRPLAGAQTIDMVYVMRSPCWHRLALPRADLPQTMASPLQESVGALLAGHVSQFRMGLCSESL